MLSTPRHHRGSGDDGEWPKGTNIHREIKNTSDVAPPLGDAPKWPLEPRIRVQSQWSERRRKIQESVTWKDLWLLRLLAWLIMVQCNIFMAKGSAETGRVTVPLRRGLAT